MCSIERLECNPRRLAGILAKMRFGEIRTTERQIPRVVIPKIVYGGME
jgi:hypothetical protein